LSRNPGRCARIVVTRLAEGAKPVDRVDTVTTKDRHMVENLGAHDVSFTAEEVREFNAEVARI